MSKSEIKPHDDAMEAAAQHAASVNISREIIARLNAHECVIETMLSLMFAAIPPEAQRAFMNDLFARRAAAAQGIADANNAQGIDAELNVATDQHIARIFRETAAHLTTASIGQPKH